MKRILLFLALVLGVVACGDTTTTTTTTPVSPATAAPATAALDLTGIKMDVHETPG